MTRAELRAAVLAALADVAPEAGPRTLRGDAPYRDQVDLDSFDFLNFVVGLHRRLGVEIPEADSADLATLDSTVDYLEKKLGR